MSELLTVAEAANRRRCSVYTVRRAIHEGRLKASRNKPRGPYVIRPEWLERWIDETTIEPELPESRQRRSRSPLPPTRGSLRQMMEQDDQEATAA